MPTMPVTTSRVAAATICLVLAATACSGSAGETGAGDGTPEAREASLPAGYDGYHSDLYADDIGGDLTPEWGMHLIDANVAMGDLVELVRAQAEAYTG